MYKIEYHKHVLKQFKLLKQANLMDKVKYLVEILKVNPFQNPPRFERLLRRFRWTLFKENKHSTQTCLFS